ncbi:MULTISPECIES: hypothetical protein [unclassified Rhizobium]|uniref:hypothetical protein n=1 Tax=unclassified Rhizobium TaxID=2613769 RepID=UPI00160A84FF|nr:MULTISPECIES: hypothetical protein [unclassified Rhizobium]MBB3382410.1 ABC-type nickel/cobalt efflux system permease component RcnA [Rhizobium sp. BK098]MBB3565972.1 ABC-type nickel/cobalt efflux system permease component RcnA [Rhizobium sp. BK491]MBB3614111.1 ABC-type nickel/cobalt efflux system permease component RcnA [Rhizobium sp. BK609]MBB3680503.1 ABC-type nickel/cobalt efflux system permease component RcnA [Rhizobium sp. BK612]
MLDTHAPNLTESIRVLVHNSDEKHHRIPASAETTKRPHKNQPRSRQVREKRTFQAMLAFGLLLGALELFIVLHYL